MGNRDLDPQMVLGEGAHSLLFGTGDEGDLGHYRERFPEIIGTSPAMEKTLEIVAKVARSDSAVLIHGESGTGKELIAAALHRLSPRSRKKFVPINCSAIPEDLLESELFGHEKGAFTGAVNRRSGYFEIASGGSIFLDEIGDMPLRLQAKLLRVLQEKQFTPVGSNEIKYSNVRIIAATNVQLEQAVKDGKFRLDLYYRLNVLPVNVPPLRMRGSDVPRLLDYFIDISNRSHGSKKPCYFSKECIDRLKDYAWPGNVRELQNLVERLVVIVGEGAITSDHLPPEVTNPRANFAMPAESDQVEGPVEASNVPSMKQIMSDQVLPTEGLHLTKFIENLENTLILQALKRTGNNKNQAAKLLGLNRTTLVERIKKRKLFLGHVTD